MSSAEISRQSPMSEVSLHFIQRIKVVYGVWWDLINNSIGIVLLVYFFLRLSVSFLNDNFQWVPTGFEDLLAFLSKVPDEKKFDIGLTMLGITLSAGSAAALYQIKVGTKRWAMNRRIFVIHDFFVRSLQEFEEIGIVEKERVNILLRSYLITIVPIFEDISGTHQLAQEKFENIRCRANVFIDTPMPRSELLTEIIVDMSCLILVMRRQVSADISIIQRVSLFRNGI